MTDPQKHLVLVVDDEEPIRKLLKARLEREGFLVQTESSAEAGAAYLNEHPEVCVMVTDVKMPGQDGITFTKMVKRLLKSVN